MGQSVLLQVTRRAKLEVRTVIAFPDEELREHTRAVLESGGITPKMILAPGMITDDELKEVGISPVAIEVLRKEVEDLKKRREPQEVQSGDDYKYVRIDGLDLSEQSEL